MIKIVALAAVLASAIGLSAPASAAPLPVTGAAHDADITLAQYRDRGHDRGYDRRRGPPPSRYVPGRRYDHAPRNWRRYDRRPGDWRRRGCVTVGPLWFCP